MFILIFTDSLKKNYQFRIVYNKGKSIANYHLVLYVLKNGKDRNRLGISISKKVGNRVIRSHKTRLIKENYRALEKELKSGYDLVFIVRVNAKESDYFEIKKAMEKLFSRACLYNDNLKNVNNTNNNASKNNIAKERKTSNDKKVTNKTN